MRALPWKATNEAASRSQPSSTMRHLPAYGAMTASHPSWYASGVGEAGLKSRSHGRAPIWSKKRQSVGTSARHCARSLVTRSRTTGENGETMIPALSA